MTKRMKYSIYKKCYSEFPAHDYEPESKMIEVEVTA